MGQGVSKGQRNNAYCVLKKLQNYYEKEKRRKMKHHSELKHSQREKRLNNNLIEVVQAMLDLAIQEHQLLEASNKVFELVMLNAKVKKLVPILETICSGAISENLWQEATEIVRVFKAIPDYEKVAKEPLARLRSMWYGAEGIRWASGSALF
ncbi:hypothetical protein V493_01182 [Pseudogymnoascus sp. VKM F-4281 (FW-2241)]|nr:hypothetical protein V493_01182 [Pseudogymnoascus sp. VKM F-4281 (FW-2241)]